MLNKGKSSGGEGHKNISKDMTGMEKVHVALPTVKRNIRKRNLNIPQSVVEFKLKEKEDDLFEQQNYTEEQRQEVEDKRLREGDQHLLEKKLKHNRIKDLMEANGGNGIYFMPDREHFQLANPEWKNDVWPEFMDGKNVFDFVDPEILEKLARLEQEEEEERNKMEVEDDDDESSDLSDDLIEAHEEVMENKSIIRKKA